MLWALQQIDDTPYHWSLSTPSPQTPPENIKNHLVFMMLSVGICDALRDLVPFVQFKNRDKHPWRSSTFSKVADFSMQLY